MNSPKACANIRLEEDVKPILQQARMIACSLGFFHFHGPRKLAFDSRGVPTKPSEVQRSVA